MEQVEESDILREKDFKMHLGFMTYVSFAEVYLERFDKESKSDREIDREIYSKLVQLDSRLGTRASEQLFWCLSLTTRSDIIKVGGFLV